MRLHRYFVAVSGHQIVLTTIVSTLSLALFLGASTAPVLKKHAISLQAAGEWGAYASSGRAMELLSHFYGIDDAVPADRLLPLDTDSHPHGSIEFGAMQDIVLGDLPVEVPLQFDLGTPADLDAESQDGDDGTFDADLQIALAAQELGIALADSFPRIPDTDSTQRAKFLPRMPRQPPTAEPFREYRSPFYLSTTKGPQVIVKVDSSRDLVTIREVLNGRDVRIPVTMPISEYIKRRYEYEREQRFIENAVQYDTTSKLSLEQFLKDITEFDIPIPPNPLLSIFGDRNRISLRMSGQVDINAGFKIESSDQQSVFLRPTQFTPNFRQRVQINLNGLVGDKLSIKADWATDRTFDYENELKIKYTGYDDEIIKSIEAGNVSLQTSSTLIQGSGALFGLKAELQFGPLRLTAVASQKKGSSATMSIKGGSQESQFTKHAYEYSENHYFVSLDYVRIYPSPFPAINPDSTNVYEAYYNHRVYGQTMPISLKPEFEIKDIEVWVSRPATAGATVDPNEREAVAFIDLENPGVPGITIPGFSSPPGVAYPTAYDTYINPNNSVTPVSGKIEVGKFLRWEKNKDYSYNPTTGILTLNQSIQDDQIVAVAYRRPDVTALTNRQSDDLIGTFSTDERFTSRSFTDPNDATKQRPGRLILKLIKPRGLVPSMTEAWQHKVRSIYSLNMRNVTVNDIAELKIVYKDGGQPENPSILEIPLLRLFGLDYTDPNGGVPDNKIDFVPGITIDPTRGELIFPTLRPWDSGLVTLFKFIKPNDDITLINPFRFPDAYDTTETAARRSDRDKIYLTGRTRGTGSSTFQLGFNIVPGSVRVIWNGQTLNPGSDYRVDENVGTVTILKTEALAPEADLQIMYEKQDLFSFASKTMVGLRGDLDVGKRSKLGFTYLSLSQQTLSDKVRIGDEPVSNSMFGIDGETSADLPLVTEALNTLPFLKTKEMSSVTAKGEVAMVLPGEDSRRSPIPSDGGKSIAYIDDFEGSRVFIPLQTAYNVWKIASVPDTMESALPPASGNETDDEQRRQRTRAKLNWYNIPISGDQSRAVRVTDIWPDRQAAREDQRVTVLDLDYYPKRRGAFNYNPAVGNGSGEENWAGIMRYLPVNASNLVDGNYNFIEMWMKVESGQKGKMYIDLGKISEDVIPNKDLNSEDIVVYGLNGRDGNLDPGEDVGLDMLTDAEERGLYTTLGDDPSGDNYLGAPNWDNFNGTEGSEKGFNGQFPDTEDLNNNGILDLTNEYFRYEISLDSTTFNSSTSPNQFVVGGGTNGWYQFRIPLSAFKTKYGNPGLDNVQFIRVLLTDVPAQTETDKMNVRIADFNFVGNQWLERIPNDKYMGVAVVNIEDNPGKYTTPPGVIRPRDRTRPDQEIYGNEQSLALDIRSLPRDTVREAYRLFPGSGIDLFNYSELKMYVHGDSTWQEPTQSDTIFFFMRFGVDSTSYYEYRAPLYHGWHERNEVDINFSKIAALKVLGYDTTTKTNTIFLDNGKTMFVKGQPDLVQVRFISVGVLNKTNAAITGQVWINELRVVAPNLEAGYAYSGSLAMKVADVADISTNVSYTDPNFHGLSERFSQSRAYSYNWSLNTTLHIDRAFPEDWKGTQARVTYSHTERLVKPKYLPGQPDVAVDDVVEQDSTTALKQGKSQREADLIALNTRVAAQTLEIRDSWALPNVKFKMPGDSWLIQDVFNRLEYNYSYTTSRFRDPIIRNRKSWEWTFKIGYGYDFGREHFIQPFARLFDGVPVLEPFAEAKWFYIPTRFGGSAELSRSRIEEQKRTNETTPVTRLFLHKREGSIDFVISENSLLNLDGNYRSSIQTSLLGLETEYGYNTNGSLILDNFGQPQTFQRQSSAIFGDIFFGDRGLFYFGDPLRYDQSFQMKSTPFIPRIFDLDRFMDISLTYQVNYYWATNPQQQNQGRSAGFNASVNSTLNFKLKSFTDPWFSQTAGSGGGDEKDPTGRSTRPQPTPSPEERKAEEERISALKSQGDPSQTRERIMQEMNEQFEKLPEAERADPVKQQEFQLRVQARLDSIDSVIRVRDSLLNLGPGAAGGRFNPFAVLGDAAYYLIKIPLLDYDMVAFTFTQQNSSQVSGVVGQTGFSAFWTTNPFGGQSDISLGPSRLYQLGLISDPNPEAAAISFKPSFPFVGIDNFRRGLRAPNPGGTYTDNYTQSNSFNISTNRPLWEGATLDLKWNVGWSINKNYTLTTDARGRQSISSVVSTGKIDRSYMAFPDFLFFSYFNTNIESVNKRYQELKADGTDRRTEAEKLAEAFEYGFEAFPWLSEVLNGMMPRVNWGIRWEGLEKWSLLDGFADRISLEHRYNSTISSAYRHSQDDGAKLTESKRVSSGFAPLIGVNLSWNEIWGGNMSLSARWSKTVGYNLQTSASNIQEEKTDEITMTGNFRKTGFEMPFLGLTLKNDVDFSLAFSYNFGRQRTYEITALDGGGQPREGTIRYTIEPRVKYTISSKVNASIFYRYQRTKPDTDGGSTVPGTTIHEGGLELRINISG